MRRVAWWSCVLALASSCGAIGSFEVPVSETGVLPGLSSSIPGAGGVDMAGSGAAVKRTIQNKGVPADAIASVTLTEASLVLVSPEGSTLAWLAGVRVFVSAPGLPRVQVAGITNVDGAGPSYPFTLDAVELKPYVTASELTLEPEFDTPETRLFADHTVRLDLTLFVSIAGAD